MTTMCTTTSRRRYAEGWKNFSPVPRQASTTLQRKTARVSAVKVLCCNEGEETHLRGVSPSCSSQGPAIEATWTTPILEASLVTTKTGDAAVAAAAAAASHQPWLVRKTKDGRRSPPGASPEVSSDQLLPWPSAARPPLTTEIALRLWGQVGPKARPLQPPSQERMPRCSNRLSPLRRELPQRRRKRWGNKNALERRDEEGQGETEEGRLPGYHSGKIVIIGKNLRDRVVLR